LKHHGCDHEMPAINPTGLQETPA